MNDTGQPVLYAIVCGSPAARHVGKLVEIGQAAGWDVCVVATPDGRKFIDVSALEKKSGHVVRSWYKDPDEPDVLPPADAMIVAPATCNTVAKWAAGISDTLPLGMVVEAFGKGIPVACVVSSSSAQLGFPAVQLAISKLADWGVRMVDYPRGEVAKGEDKHARFPWAAAFDAIQSEASG
ncbi:flavoprotein [Kutzneria albida]|uniref:flavoprotein n=1 Tax=Kutzneria albida TaxID=43357 RepID=UPI0009DD5448|nr:flavoprotein [Kutzneria albida]